MLSPAQWSSSVQLLQLASLCLHGTYLNYMTDCHSVLCCMVSCQCGNSVNRLWPQVPNSVEVLYVTEAFSLYSGIARCLPQLLDH